MERHLTPAQAWAHFWENNRPTPIPNELSVAHRAFQGYASRRSGSPIRLGAKRIARLLDKYAKGKYEFIEPAEGYFLLKEQ